jgi:hypothetical protein
MRMKPSTRRRTKLIVGLGAFFIALWLLWWTPIVLPLKLFVVLLHEVSHALAAVVTGGTVERMVLQADEGGATYARGGNAFVMLSAGYLGSLLWGLLLIELAGAQARSARTALMILAAALLIIAGLFVRNIFGFIFTAASGAVLFVAARQFSARGVAVVLLVLGLTSSLYALLDIRSDILRRPGQESDAYMLAQLTGVPTLAWGVLWIGVAALACWLGLKRWLRRA